MSSSSSLEGQEEEEDYVPDELETDHEEEEGGGEERRRSVPPMKKRKVRDVLRRLPREEDTSSSAAVGASTTLNDRIQVEYAKAVSTQWFPDLYVLVGRFRESRYVTAVTTMINVYRVSNIDEGAALCTQLLVNLADVEDKLFTLVLLIADPATPLRQRPILVQAAKGYAISFHEYRSVVQQLASSQQDFPLQWDPQWLEVWSASPSALTVEQMDEGMSEEDQRLFAVGKRTFVCVQAKEILHVMHRLEKVGLQRLDPTKHTVQPQPGDPLSRLTSVEDLQSRYASLSSVIDLLTRGRRDKELKLHGAYYRMALSLSIAFLHVA